MTYYELILNQMDKFETQTHDFCKKNIFWFLVLGPGSDPGFGPEPGDGPSPEPEPGPTPHQARVRFN